MCIERDKEIFVIVNSTECNYAALQLRSTTSVAAVLVEKKKKKVFVYFNDSRVYRKGK